MVSGTLLNIKRNNVNLGFGRGFMISTSKKNNTKRPMAVINNWQLYLMLLLPLIYIVVFAYVPMYGAVIAFKKFSPALGILGSPWIGFDQFYRFVTHPNFISLLKNTLYLSLYSIIAGFPLPILFALFLNAIRNRHFKKTVQMITYIPYFISTVVLIGIIFQFFNPRIGPLSQILAYFSGQPVDIFRNPNNFAHIMVWSGVWQGLGFNSIIYLSILSGVSPELHEAAVIDGASRWNRIWHIDFTSLLPTATIFLIMSIGGILSTGYEKILLFQNNLNLSVSEVIDTYAYKIGIISSIPDASYATAIGLFKSVIGFILIIIVNKISNKINDSGIW